MKIKYRKKFIIVLCALCMLTGLLAGCSSKTDNTSSADALLQKIVIGSDNYPPYNYDDANGNPTGIDVDLATEAFKRMGYQAEFKIIDWEEKNSL